MRLHRNTIAAAATVLTLAAGGGVAYACSPGGPGDPGGWGTTGSTGTTGATTGSTGTTGTTNAVRLSHSRHHSRRHAVRG